MLRQMAQGTSVSLADSQGLKKVSLHAGEVLKPQEEVPMYDLIIFLWNIFHFYYIIFHFLI